MALEAQELAVRVRLLDGTAFEAEADRAASSLGRFREEATALNTESGLGNDAGLLGMFGKAEKSLDSMHSKLMRWSGTALQVGRQTAAVSAGAAFGIYESIKKYTETGSLSVMLESQAHASKQQREELENTYQSFAKYGVGPEEVARSYYPLQSVLRNTKQDYEALTAAAMGAKVGHDSPMHAAEAVASFWEARAKKNSGVNSFAEQMALLDETVGAGKMHLPTLNEVMNTRLMQVAGADGINQRGILSILAGVSASMGEGGVVSFAQVMKTAIAKAQGLKGEALSDARKLGLGEYTLSEQLRNGPFGPIEMLRTLGGSEKNLGVNEWTKLVNGMFGGARSASTILTAIENLPKIEEDYSKYISRVHGTATLEGHFAQANSVPKAKMEQLRATVEGDEYKLGKTLLPTVMVGLEWLTKALSAVTGIFNAMPKPTKDVAAGLVIFAAVLSPFSFALAGIFRMGAIVVTVTKWFWGLEFVQARLIPQLGIWSGEMTGITAETAAVGTGLGTLAGFIAPGAVLFLGLEALNRVLGGKHWLGAEVFDKGKHLGEKAAPAISQAFHDIFGGYTAAEVEQKRKKQLHELETGERLFIKPHNGLERAAQAEALNRAAFEGKIVFHVTTKLDADGKELAKVVNRANANGEARR